MSTKTHRSRGGPYRRNVVAAEGAAVTRTRGHRSVWTPDRTDTARVKQLLDTCSPTHAERLFPARLQALLPRVQHYALAAPTLAITPLHARWGSCTAESAITLNLRLMQVPRRCIDYVIMQNLPPDRTQPQPAVLSTARPYAAGLARAATAAE